MSDEIKTPKKKVPPVPKKVQKGCIIQGRDFILKFLKEGGDDVDLYLLKYVNKGKPNQKLVWKIYGYGYSIESAIRKIIQFRVRKRQLIFKDKGDMGLVNYFNMWIEERNKVLSIFNFSQEQWDILTKFKKIALEDIDMSDPVNAEIVEESDEDKVEEENNEEENND